LALVRAGSIVDADTRKGVPMSSTNVVLEPSEGSSIPNPTGEQIRSMLERIGNGLDHCILDLGAETEYVQAAGAANRLLVQYRDTAGMFESLRSDLDVAAVHRIFLDAMAGATGWKQEFAFRPLNTAAGADSPPRAASSPKKSPEQELLDAARRKAKAGIDRVVKGGLRRLFGGKP
jgi:hypothetical protein